MNTTPYWPIAFRLRLLATARPVSDSAMMPPSSQITLDRLVMLIPSQGDGSIMLVSCLQVHVCASSSLRQLANTIFRILPGRISLNLQLQSTWDKDELIKFCGQKSKVKVMTRPNIDKKGHHVLATLLQSCCVVLKYVFFSSNYCYDYWLCYCSYLYWLYNSGRIVVDKWKFCD